MSKDAKPSKGKRATKLEQLRAQGRWQEATMPDGSKMPVFVMPTPELQEEFDKKLEDWIKSDLKKRGFKLVFGTRREHPFHSDLLRERIDRLTEGSALLFDKERIEAERRECNSMVGDPSLTLRAGDVVIPFTQDVADGVFERAMQRAVTAWAATYNTYRDMVRNADYWRGSIFYDIYFPKDEPPLPDGPPPKPAYVSKDNPYRVLQVLDGFVHIWIRT